MADEERVEPTLDADAPPPQAIPHEPEAEEVKPKSKKGLFIIIGLVVVLAGAVGGYFYMQHKAELKREQEAEEKRPENILKRQLMERKENAPPNNIPLEEMIVNLPGRGGEHYLQTKIVLRTNDSATEGKIKNFMPVIRDKIITVLSSRQMQELATVEGKVMMAREIALVINSVEERRNAIVDSRHIRTSALLARVTTYTTIAGAEAAVEGMKYLDNLSIISVQEMHAQLVLA
jgi:flagellar basal body-associated protein FliL